MTDQIKRDSFIFYRSFFEAINDLDNKQQLEIFRAISEYSLNDKLIELSGTSKTIFRLIEPQLLANKKRYLNGKLGAEHGSKGGRPKNPKKTPKKPQVNPSLTPNENENENENPKSELELKLESIKVDYGNWVGFVKMRKKLKKPLTEKAEELIIKKLSELEEKKEGSANKALENSIANSWQGVFEPKDYQQKQEQKPVDSLAIQINQIIGQDLISKVYEATRDDEKVTEVKFNTMHDRDKWLKLSDETKQKAKDIILAKFKNQKMRMA